MAPTKRSWLKIAQRGDRLLRDDHAEKNPTSTMMGSDPRPTNSICSRNSAQPERAAEQPAQRLAQHDAVIAE